MLDLLDEYMTACEGGEDVNLAPYEKRAGERVDELRRQVAIVQQIRNIPGLIQEVGGRAIIGRFQTLGLLGRGGSSRVYHAKDSELDREIALKMFSDLGPGVDRDSIAEARALARLDHPGVVRVYEVGEHEEQAYIAMEHVEGTDLRSVLRAMRAMAGNVHASDLGSSNLAFSVREEGVARQLESTVARCRLVALIARALAYCHHEGIVHRDIKPENVLIGAELQPKLIDFGLARSHGPDATHPTGRLRGTPAYLAPEQVDNAVSGASAASDQFALGTVLYELLTLEQPFRSPTLEGTMAKVSAAAPVAPRRLRPGLPSDVELICLKALGRDPDQRYPSLSALAEDLEAFVDHRAISIRQPTPLRLVLRSLRRNPKRLFLMACAVAALCVAVGLALTEHRRTRFLSGLEEARARVSATSEPDALRETFLFIRNGWMEAARLDSTLVGMLHGTKVEDQVEDTWSTALDRLLEAFRGFKRAIKPSVRDAELGKFLENWGGVAELGRESCPPGKGSVDILRTGTVDLPEGGVLVRYASSSPGLPKFSAIANPAGSLEAGLYRYTLPLDGEMIETEFFIRPLELRWKPRVESFSPKLAKHMVQVGAGTVPLDEAGGERAYSAFLISPKPVTWSQCWQVFEYDELSYIENLSGRMHDDRSEGSDSAVLPFIYASEYASRVGARIPTPVELWVATQHASVEFDPEITQEWVSTVYNTEPWQRFARGYSAGPREGSAIYNSDVGGGFSEETLVTDTGFRVVFSGERK